MHLFIIPTHTGELRDLRAEHEREIKKLEDEMAAKKAKESSALKERLAAKRKKRQTEIQTEKGVSEVEAAAEAAVEMKAEEVKEMTKLQETLEVHPQRTFLPYLTSCPPYPALM